MTDILDLVRVAVVEQIGNSDHSSLSRVISPLLSLRCSPRVRHCLCSLVNEGGGLVCESVGKADLLSDHFDSKQQEGC